MIFDTADSISGDFSLRVATKAAAIFAVALGTAVVLASCSDANIYSPGQELRQVDRVGLTGTVCTDDPARAEFPHRIVLVVDESQGPLYSEYDVAGTRFRIFEDFVDAVMAGRENQVAVVGYGGQPRRLAPETGSFTRNPGELNDAITALRNPEPCFAEDQCRNLRESIHLTRSIIEDDLVQTPRGVRALTQYSVIHLHSGEPSPLADGADCCPEDDVECIDEQSGPSFECEAQLAGDAVFDLRESIRDLGGAGLRYHTIQWAAHDDDGNGDDDDDSAAEHLDDQIEHVLQMMAFTGNGTTERFNAVEGFTFAAMNLLHHRVGYEADDVLVTNMNVLPGPDGPRVDSDADGIPDHEEELLGLSPTSRDTSQDGLSDLVKITAGMEPTDTRDEPYPGCEDLPTLDHDTTADGLTDCDNLVLGTDPTLVDTAGDGIPDILQLFYGTNYLKRDARVDYDGDGVASGQEIRQNTDPRSFDVQHHLNYGYRYEIDDLGMIRDLQNQALRDLTGVRITHISEGTTPGIGDIIYDADEQTLEWIDAADDASGPAVSVHDEQPLRLASSSWAPEQGEEGRFVEVEVDPTALPDRSVAERTRVVFRDRHCLEFTVRNIKLMETRELDDGTPAGTNQLLLFFSQSPAGSSESPATYRIASVPVHFDPPDERDPPDAIIPVDDDRFVRPPVADALWDLED